MPVVSAAVSAGTRRAYGSYWNRVVGHWGSRRLDEPTPSEIRQLMAYTKTHVVSRCNARGGRSAEEHLVAALRCLYQRAVDDGLIAEADNPARKVAKPRRLPTSWDCSRNAFLAYQAVMPAPMSSPTVARAPVHVATRRDMAEGYGGAQVVTREMAYRPTSTVAVQWAQWVLTSGC